MPSQVSFDPYRTLGVARDASPLQVARAHRRLAKRYHPDLHPGEDVSERMRRINDAWHILSSSVRRAEYDLLHPHAANGAGHWAPSRREFRPAPPTTTRSWATWRASAADTRSAPRTRRQPGEVPVNPVRRPEPILPAKRSFRDSGWAALLVAIACLLLLAAAIVAGRLA
jgi:curved DNA-binding protein CbpA